MLLSRPAAETHDLRHVAQDLLQLVCRQQCVRDLHHRPDYRSAGTWVMVLASLTIFLPSSGPGSEAALQSLHLEHDGRPAPIYDTQALDDVRPCQLSGSRRSPTWESNVGWAAGS